MPFNNLTSRGDAQALIPEEIAKNIIQGATQQSAALRLFPHLPMSRKQMRLPVLSALPTAYWVNGDTGLKQTTKMAWANKYVEAEPIAVVVPVPEEVLDDSEYDIFEQMRPKIEEAIGRALDETIFFNVNKPPSFADGIAIGANAAGNTRDLGTAIKADGGIAEDFNQVFGRVEADGYDVNGVVSRTGIKSKMRGARDANGQQLLDVAGGTLFGQYGLEYVMNGLWPKPTIGAGAGAAAGIDAIAGDFTQGILGVRQDIAYKVITEGVITDNTGAIQINLPQQDAIALRVVARFGFAVANPINYENPNPATRYPWAVLRTPGT